MLLKNKRIESETGVKQNVTQQDIEDLEHKIEELEVKRKETGKYRKSNLGVLYLHGLSIEKQWKNRVQLQEDRLKRIQHESTQMELKYKEKENEYR